MRTRDHIATDGLSQIHTYGGGPANTRDHWDNLAFDPITEFSHGHHARAGGGHDTFNFRNLDNVSGVVVGRLEDFDPSRDEIRLDGVLLDLDNLPDNVRIVSYNGGHNDPGAAPQPWLLIETAAGGYVFYALEGARIDMNGDGGSNGGDHENHFLSEGMVPDFDSLPDHDFSDPENVVPAGVAPRGGVVINDIDIDAGDVHAVVTGSGRGDLIAAGLNDDSVRGEGGDDRIWGGSGDDTIRGGGGHDTIRGGSGADELRGGNGFDALDGGGGHDMLIAGNGRDTVAGGDGNDVLQDNGQRGWLGGDLFFGGDGRDTLHGGGGNDTLRGGSGADRLFGGRDDDRLFGGAGQDTLKGQNGNDRLFGGTGNDRLDGGFNYDEIDGGHGNDTLIGGNGRDTLDGGSGDDLLRDNGQAGAHGGDLLRGGDGRDRIHVGGGIDTVTGGAGSDTFVFAAGHGDDVITDFDARDPGERIDLSAISAIRDIGDLMAAARQVGGDVLIDTGGGNSILLENVSRSDLGGSDFIFT